MQQLRGLITAKYKTIIGIVENLEQFYLKMFSHKQLGYRKGCKDKFTLCSNRLII